MIQPVTKQTDCLTPMLFDGQRPLRAQPLAYDMRPAEGQRHERQQFLQPLGVGDVRGFEAEAAPLQTAEQRLDLPAPRVVLKGRLGLALRDHDHVLTLGQAHPRDMPLLAPDQARPSKRLSLSDAAMAEQLTSGNYSPARIGDAG